MTNWAPHCPMGTTGAPVAMARRAAPVLPVMGHCSGSRERVPSGKTMMTSPERRTLSASLRESPASLVARWTGICPPARRMAPRTGTSKSVDLARE